MANVRDSDISLWLHNKLGTSNDSWISGSICSQLNEEVLRNIKDCFPDLQTQVKLKLLLSFFHIPRRHVEEWKTELDEVIEVACIDSELWVSMIAETMKTFPATGSLNTEISEYNETRPIFTDMVSDLKKLLNKHSDLAMLPLECQYLNKAALVSVVGQQSAAVKHFTLKRKPKSAALRTELLQKSADAQSSLKKSTAPTIPLRSRGMPRKMTDTTPLKGIPSRVPSGGFKSPTSSQSQNRPNLSRTPAGRKDGGIKLLEITEQPLGYAAAKKRKRQQEIEEQQKRTLEAQSQSVSTTATTTSIPTTTTPDYAAGLSVNSVYTQPATPAPIVKESPATPAPTITTQVPLPAVASTTSTPTTPTLTVPTVVVTSTITATVSRPTIVTSVVTSASTVPAIIKSELTSDITPVSSIVTTGVTSTKMMIQTPINITKSTPVQPSLVQPTIVKIAKPNIPAVITPVSVSNVPTNIPSLTAFSTISSAQLSQAQPKLVQIKTTSNMPVMVSSGNNVGNIPNLPPLIPTQQPTILNIQNLNLQGRKTMTIAGTNTVVSTVGTIINTVQPQLQTIAQIQQQPHTVQANVSQMLTGTTQKYTQVVVPSNVNVKGKTIILANPNMLTQKGGVLLRSIGPGGNTVYQQIPISNVSGLANLSGATILTGPPGLIKTSDGLGHTIQLQPVSSTSNQMPALVPTSSVSQAMPPLTPVVITSHSQGQQALPTLITNVSGLQQHGQQPPSGTIIRPVLTTNVQTMSMVPQGLTLIQRPGGQPTLVQTIQTTGGQIQQQQQHIQRAIIKQQTPASQQTFQQVPATIQIQQHPKKQTTTTTVVQQVSNASGEQVPRKGISLSAEHVSKAHEMFKRANRVTRLDKALILSFMSGFQQNPRPNAENAITIKLGDTQETVKQENETYALMFVESFIRLDYNTGEWKTFQKCRRIDQSTQQQSSADTQTINAAANQNSVVI